MPPPPARKPAAPSVPPIPPVHETSSPSAVSPVSKFLTISIVPPSLHGADSRAAIIAETPTTSAAVQYHAGAIGFPVFRISHVTTYCVLPPNVAMDTA